MRRGAALATVRTLVFGLTLASGCGMAGADALVGHGGPVTAIATAPDGSVATGSFDYAVGLWSEGRPTWLDGHRAAVNAVLWLPDGRLASGGDDFDILIWQGGTSERLAGHRGRIVDLALAPDGTTLVSASWDGSLGLWDLTGAAPARFLTGHGAPVNAVAFMGDTLLSAGADGSLRAWNAQTGAPLRQIVRHGFGINRIVVGPDWLAYGAVDGASRIVDPAAGTEIAEIGAGRRPILSLALSPDGSLLAVGDGEGHILLVETDGWSVRRDISPTRPGPVWALAFTPDGGLLASGLAPDVVKVPLDKPPRDTPPRPVATAEQAGMADNGAHQFARKCAICHTLTPGSDRRAGPTLHGLFGRRAGAVADYSYSPALDRATLVWSDTTIDALFDIGPDHYLPGTKMPMQRITGAADRRDLIGYLRHATATDPQAAQPERTRP